MLKSLCVLFLAVAGSLASEEFWECTRSKCDNTPLLEGLEGVIPNEEELKNLCTPMLERSECLQNAIQECTGKTLQELALTDNVTVASFAALMLNLHGIIVDLCNEDSILHEGYVSSVTCFNGVLQDRSPKCHKEAMAIYAAYRESVKLLDEEDSDNKMKDSDCLISAYVTACFSLEVKDRCGELAGSTFVEVLRRTKFLSFGAGTCSKDQLQVLRTEYLEFLELEEEKKTWFSEVFNTRK